jgi:hypothetical protein
MRIIDAALLIENRVEGLQKAYDAIILKNDKKTANSIIKKIEQIDPYDDKIWSVAIANDQISNKVNVENKSDFERLKDVFANLKKYIYIVKNKAPGRGHTSVQIGKLKEKIPNPKTSSCDDVSKWVGSVNELLDSYNKVEKNIKSIMEKKIGKYIYRMYEINNMADGNSAFMDMIFSYCVMDSHFDEHGGPPHYVISYQHEDIPMEFQYAAIVGEVDYDYDEITVVGKENDERADNSKLKSKLSDFIDFALKRKREKAKRSRFEKIVELADKAMSKMIKNEKLKNVLDFVFDVVGEFVLSSHAIKKINNEDHAKAEEIVIGLLEEIDSRYASKNNSDEIILMMHMSNLGNDFLNHVRKFSERIYSKMKSFDALDEKIESLIKKDIEAVNNLIAENESFAIHLFRNENLINLIIEQKNNDEALMSILRKMIYYGSWTGAFLKEETAVNIIMAIHNGKYKENIEKFISINKNDLTDVEISLLKHIGIGKDAAIEIKRRMNEK